MRHHQNLVRSGAETVRIVLHGQVRRGIQRVALRGLQDEARIRHPVVQPLAVPGLEVPLGRFRSEEHASELQSLMRSSYAVFCLKKKNNTITSTTPTQTTSTRTLHIQLL